MNSSVALLSGGLDSTVATFMALNDGGVALALTANYGQRCAAREAKAAGEICRILGIPHRIIELSFMDEISQNSALINGPLPKLERADLDRGGEAIRESAKAVWVPNRNGLLVNAAAAFAESMGLGKIVVGWNREEGETFPDNTQGFLEALNSALHFSTANGVKVISPTISLTKMEIVSRAFEIGAPLTWIWPCYECLSDLCWKCESCLRLERALDESGYLTRFLSERKAAYRVS